MKQKGLVGAMLIIFVVTFNFSNIFACGTQIGIESTISSSTYIKTDNRYAYVSVGWYLKIVDLLDESNPVIVSTTQVPYESKFYKPYASALDVVGDYVFLTDKDGYLHSIDVSNRENPVIKKSLQVGQDGNDHGKDVQIVGSYAYVVFLSGLSVVDISDPENFSVVGSFPQTDSYSVAVNGNHVYIGCAGIRIVDMSDMENPVDEGLFTGPSGLGFVRKMSLRWPYLYIANGHFGVIDVTDPINLVLIKRYTTYNITVDVDISNDGMFAYLSNGNSNGGTAEVLNIFDPENPLRVCLMSIYRIGGMALKGNLAVIGSHAGLQLVEFALPPVLNTKFDSNHGERIIGIELSSGSDIEVLNCEDGNCFVPLDSGTYVELTAFDKPGYLFDYWDDGMSCNYDNPITIELWGNWEWTAMFKETPMLNVVVGEHGKKVEGRLVSNNQLVINCGDGETDCSYATDSGTQIRFTATANPGHSLVQWEDDGVEGARSIQQGYPLVVTVGDVHKNVTTVFREGFRDATGDFRKSAGSDGGQCVAYVRYETDIPWEGCNGEASTCYADAIGAGFSTGSTAQVGAIIVFGAQESMTNGHVGIVTAISGDNITIRDSNWCTDKPINCEDVEEHVVNVSGYTINGYIYDN